ncbi:putative AT-hook motif nuclear-localized protein [Helianthus annuus]|uniref:AT-hook motif nuclear-localized protein n=1 Tax=Helianthus annuus TaxID=4232 RepID=A0A251V9Y4_HELAN|nr:AT-hook motif nuclear-localized protein 9 [Helianthus annuus]XP_022029482.1 AT-hook motif nuclear-localized protein 9 [Helianthus annuus]XP_022029483.1 AT-hook motif nuclear-localized protein 9 [Helianthus annuus]XP_035843584.1 AT-hook motif nuclear-localized protein 9 [Helianthus annuus]KAF5816075.1 putative AT-hook motif nuclear-localized protein [Helianthus annuus]KAJ0602611.1 putative AT-hook motif nuclear-localized protein [Helianthus annuus]KAJ0609468.1 putative AT-hook motif nuclear
MDGREGIPSFYLNRGFRGSGSNVGPGSNGGSGNQGGGFQVPPGFKTQANPNLSPHGHSNMRLAPSMGSSFHLEHNPPPQPPSGFPHGFNLDGGGSGGGGGGSGSGGVSEDGGGAASIPAIPDPRSGNESIVKKKRGRPRKYAPDASHMALALTPAPAVATPDPTTPTPQKKRGRPRGSGRKQQLANVGEWMHNSAGSAFTPHIIHVAVGEDVAEKILSFAQQRQRALCILSGNGSVSTLTLRQFTSSGGTVTYEGRFEILCLSGCYLLAETGSPRNRTGGLSISVCNSDGQVLGGAIGGKLIASTLVQVVVSSFLHGGGGGGGDIPKAKTAIEPPSGDEKSPGVQLN